MRASTFFGLIFCNVLWSAVYSVSKHLFAHYHPLEVSFLRYFTGGIPLLIYCAWGGRKSLLASFVRTIHPSDWRILVVGMLTFFVSPLTQMTGLHLSRAIDGALMIAMEPLFTVLAACVLLRERLRLIQVFSLAIALTGACVLTDVTWGKFSSFSEARLIGNSIFLISMVSEAAYSVTAQPLLKRRSPVLIVTVALWVGIALLFSYNLAVDGPARLAGIVPLIQRQEWSEWLSFLYQGLACTAFGYMYWMIALADAPVSIMAITLYVQPVLGTFWGHYFLGESITISTFVGAFLILAAVWIGSHPTKQTDPARVATIP